ncbi:hypothetical protein OPV22_001987 [Ensete ventricosum]|uniref:PH domain-containing protein n=1 Tax=Ensete ventricosum TaxID=4639 RepID=A0AAV8RWM2_ENSVE|nr:hypothetical protein OPV22_001987 [Ensete ventricosum]
MAHFFHHHHHHHHGEEHGSSAGGRSAPRTVRVYTKADPNYSLSIRDGDVILAPNDPDDPYQHWYKDMRHGTRVKDEEGFPGFALVNSVTGETIKHSLGAQNQVRLVPYNPDYLDESVLWSESNDTGKGYRCIRMVNNIRLNFDAFHGDKDHGGVRDGTTVVLWEWLKGDNQRWKIEPQSSDPPPPTNYVGGRPPQRAVRIFTKAGPDYSLTVRDGSVVLAPTDPNDDYQRWYKDMRYSTEVKDEEGFPSFALVNKVTGEAIKHAIGAKNPIRLVPYNPDYLDESVLWSESNDTGEGYRGQPEVEDCSCSLNNVMAVSITISWSRFAALHSIYKLVDVFPRISCALRPLCRSFLLAFAVLWLCYCGAMPLLYGVDLHAFC